MGSDELLRYRERFEPELFDKFLKEKGLEEDFEEFAFNDWQSYEAGKLDYLY